MPSRLVLKLRETAALIRQMVGGEVFGDEGHGGARIDRLLASLSHRNVRGNRYRMVTVCSSMGTVAAPIVISPVAISRKPKTRPAAAACGSKFDGTLTAPTSRPA